jgi:hypothetical protein
LTTLTLAGTCHAKRVDAFVGLNCVTCNISRRIRSVSGPIVRTGTTPKFWRNWDNVFGKKKPKTAAAGKKKTARKSAKKSAARKGKRG